MFTVFTSFDLRIFRYFILNPGFLSAISATWSFALGVLSTVIRYPSTAIIICRTTIVIPAIAALLRLKRCHVLLFVLGFEGAAAILSDEVLKFFRCYALIILSWLPNNETVKYCRNLFVLFYRNHSALQKISSAI